LNLSKRPASNLLSGIGIFCVTGCEATVSGGAYRLFPVFCSGNCFGNILCFFCSISHIVFDGVLFCIQDCHRFFANFFAGHQEKTTCDKCNRDVLERKIATLYFLRCKVMKIQFFPNALKGNLKNETLKAGFAAGSAGYFF
jgi:hypothetical protein